MDPQQFLTELDSQLRSVVEQFLATTPAATEVTATDDSGRVSVTLHPDRTLARVQVAADWQEEIEPSVLAATILEVAGRAQWGPQDEGDDGAPVAADIDQQDVDDAVEALLREKTAELMAPVSPAELQRQADALPGLLDQLDAQLDDAIARSAEARDEDLPSEDADGHQDAVLEVVESENRMVSVGLSAGHLGEVRIKESWVRGLSGIAVTQCFDQIMDRIAANTNHPEPR